MSKIASLFSTTTNIKVIDSSIEYSDYTFINLSESNSNLANLNLNNTLEFEKYIENYLSKNKAKIAYGGYLERRNLYKRSTVFKNETSNERDIHIGLDLWINEQASIFAALDGTIHSFQNNDALGDYGPTLILQHQLEDFTFHTLYGHLSLDSLMDKKVGDFVQKGTQIATLGLPPINGDYAPHLHFQIIIDMQNKKGDYPGVCNEKDLKFYTENCPDPNLLLKIIGI